MNRLPCLVRHFWDQNVLSLGTQHPSCSNSELHVPHSHRYGTALVEEGGGGGGLAFKHNLLYRLRLPPFDGKEEWPVVAEHYDGWEIGLW